VLNPKEAYLQTAPVQYENKKHILSQAGEYLSPWGNKILISGGRKALKASLNRIEKGLHKEEDLKWEKHTFIGECCDDNIDEVSRKAQNFEADIILGVGGGKSIDTAKVAAEKAGCYLAAVPTIASTCSAASAFSVVYTSAGLHLRSHYLTSHPVLVLIDPEIIAEAPVKYLKSGIIDGLSKWYEGRAVIEGMEDPDLFSQSAIKLAELLEREIRKHAYPSVQSCQKNRASKALMKVIDLNVYLTGVIQSLGQKTSRGAAVHAIHNGLTVMEESHEILHGIKIAYGIIVQLFLENKTDKEINALVNFFKKLDVVPSLAGLGLPADPDILQKVGEKAVREEVMYRMPEKIELEDLLKAMNQTEIFV